MNGKGRGRDIFDVCFCFTFYFVFFSLMWFCFVRFCFLVCSLIFLVFVCLDLFWCLVLLFVGFVFGSGCFWMGFWFMLDLLSSVEFEVLLCLGGGRPMI